MFRTKPFIASIPLLFFLGTPSVHAEGTAGELLPRIVRTESGLQSKAQLTPRSASAAFNYMGDLALVLAFQGATETSDASRADLERLHFSDALAAKTALDNFMLICPPKFQRFEGNVWAVDTPYQCQSAPYLLHDSLWGGVGKRLANGVVAALPTLDGPIFFVPADDPVAVERLSRLIQTEQARSTTRPLSTHLYLYRAGEWAMLESGAGK